MRLICPNCDAQYEVADGAIPTEGRDVQCSNCGHAWFQMSPEVEAAQRAEQALFDAPKELATPAADHDDDLPPEAFEPPAPLPRRSMDDSLLAVLREEAEREAQVRKAESPRAIETQTDLGLDAAPAAVISPAARRIAQLKGIDPDAAPAQPAKPATRRELLPDIEEINSTLRPSTERGDDEDGLPPVEPVAPQKGRFGTGFALMLILGGVLALAYVMAPRIGEQIPGAAAAMDSYVAMVDGARMWLDALMRKAISALQGQGA